MSKPLEPTREQLDAVVRAMCNVPIAQIYDEARVAWALIRDMVLEAAARACSRPVVIAGTMNCVPDNDECARRIRAMKGTP